MRSPADVAGGSLSGVLKIKDSYGRMRKLALKPIEEVHV